MSFREAILNGLAPDGGLYMPDSVPQIGRDEMLGYRSKEYHEIASAVMGHFLKDEIDDKILENICRDAYNFDVPVEEVYNNNYILRLDQGPTASFKDFAARVMARLMNFFLTGTGRKLTILTATSGDTGGAVANAFHGLDNIKVIVLFPRSEVSSLQRKQMTTLKGNVHAISVAGKFDDCQHLAKTAFRDLSLSDLHLSSANSINIGRLLPQSVYYFYAWSGLAVNGTEKIFFSVPSGNFGNLTGGLLAHKMGLPVEQFIVCTNRNDEVPEFLKSGLYKIISPSHNCISSAMNVGHPSNLARIVDLYGGEMDEKGSVCREPDLDKMRADLFGIAISETDTRMTIADVFKKSGVLLEPHGAVAWKGLEYYKDRNASKPGMDDIYISLETAHPAKFSEEIKNLLGFTPDLPPSLSGLNETEEEFTELYNNYVQLRKLLSEL